MCIRDRDSITPIEENRLFGLYRKHEGEVENLAAPIWNWGKYYEKILRQILNGGWTAGEAKKDQALNYYWGMSADVIDVAYSTRTVSYTHLDVYKRQDSRCNCSSDFYHGFYFPTDSGP